MVRLQKNHLNKLNLYLDLKNLTTELTASTNNLMEIKQEKVTNFTIEKIIEKEQK